MHLSKKAKILIVDDSATNLKLLAELLNKDYSVKVAKNGEQALELAQSQPDLILLDIIMPGISGYEVCRRLKNNPVTQNIPIIFITGKTDTDDEEKGLNLGAVDYITKPIRPAIVLARVKTQITLRKQYQQLRYLAMHDQLTGLFNRHYLERVAQDKMARSKRHKTPMSLIIMDIDHFKKVNDYYGHPGGDKVLVEFAQVIQHHCRTEDVPARIGGEEFVILLDHCDYQQALRKAENLRSVIENYQFQAAELADLKITSSFGVAQLLPEEHNYPELLKRADKALYQAKEQGRNQVVGNPVQQAA